MKKLRLLMMILASVLTLNGCSYIDTITAMRESEAEASPKPNTENTRVATDVHFGSGLTISMRPPKTLNPLINEDASVDRVLKLMFEQICIIDENMKAVPNLLENVAFAANGLSCDVTLKTGIYWEDGMKMTSGDIKFSLDVIEISQTGLYKEVVSDIESIVIIDDLNFKVKFKNPQGGQLYSLCFPAIPRHYYSGRLSLDSSVNFAPIGNGQYAATQVKPVSSIQLVASQSGLKDTPLIQNINIVITNDSNTDLQAFEQGMIDAVDSDMLGFGKYSGSKNISATPYDTNYYTFIGFNYKNIIFEDRRVREAVAYSIDKDYILENIYLNNGYKANSIINPVSYLYDSSVKEYGFNLRNAKDNLFAAGFRDNDLDGILDREAAGVTFKLSLKLLVNEESAERKKIADMLKINMESLGLEVVIDSCDFETYKGKLESGEFDLVLGAFNFSLKPEFDFAFNSSSIGSKSNFFSYRSEIMDSLLNNISIAIDEAAYFEAMQGLQRHFSTELPCVGIAFVQRALLTDSNIKGEKLPVKENIFYNISDWYIE